jgi:hypothetical protein
MEGHLKLLVNFQERERLQAMMTHLHLNKKRQEERRMQEEQKEISRSPEPMQPQASLQKPMGFCPPMPNMGFPPNLGGMPGFPGARPPGFRSANQIQKMKK